MKLVVAEKPSVARDIAAEIGANEKVNGVLTGNGFMVTSARGHLVRVKRPEEYDSKYEKWELADLPIVPDFEFTPLEDAEDVLDNLTELMNSADVDEIIEELKSGRLKNVAERSGRQQDKEDGGGLEELRKNGYM